MEKRNKIIIFIIIFFTLNVIIFSYAFYQIGDYGRFIRDNGVYSSGISDNDVKSIWCGMKGLENSYKEINGNEFCGEIQIEMNCRFTNRGDYCSIKRLSEEGKGIQ